MAGSINVDIIVKAIAQGFDKLAQTFDKTARASEKLDQGARKSGLSITDLKSAFDLATQAAGMFFDIIGEVYQLGEMGAQFARLGAAGQDLAKSLGSSYDEIIAKLDEAAMGTVSNSDLMLGANRAMMLGLGSDADKLANLMEVAALRGRAMGISTTQAFSDIVTGIGRMSPMILDNLGIVIDAKTRYEEYADANGIAADAIDAATKRQILLNSVLAEGNTMLEEAGGAAADSATKYEQLGAQTDNLKTTVGQIVDQTFGGLVDGANESVQAVGGWAESLLAAVQAENALLDAAKAGTITMTDANTQIEKFTWTSYSAADALEWLAEKQSEANAGQQEKIAYGVMAQASYDRDRDAILSVGQATGYTTEQVKMMIAAQKRLSQQMSDQAQAADEYATRVTDMGRAIANATPGLVNEIGGFMEKVNWAQAGGGVAEGIFAQLKSAIEATNDPGKIAELESLIAPILAGAFNAAIDSGQMKENAAKIDLAKMLGIDKASAGDLLDMFSPEDLQNIQTQIMQIMSPEAFGMDTLPNLFDAANFAMGDFDGLEGGMQGLADSAPVAAAGFEDLAVGIGNSQQPAQNLSNLVNDELEPGISNAEKATKKWVDWIAELDDKEVTITINEEHNISYNYSSSGSGGGQGFGGAPPPNCFAPGTPVAMANGEDWPIEDVQIGDSVMAFDARTLEFSAGRVSATIARHAPVRLRFSLANGAQFICTPAHPFYQPGAAYHGRRDFIAASDLDVGDELYQPGADSLTRVRIEAIEQLPGGPVHNLTVEPQHTYIAAGVMVHNVKAATGLADFTVPAGYPNDSYPIWVTSGERVNVETAAQRASAQSAITAGVNGGGGSMINYNYISDFTTAEYYARAQARAARFARINAHMGV